ncbi:cardiolipin synthase [Spinactinospora alkalitolerans]|uniref:Cardiolipin synthase n=1 Tax=Spinactinospora alkalitolerans TaxID=687207 RepID=A0A852TWM1_9ACTN|nr:phospholipase D-like domain-containing protein [Spinactinospora alkalitolerans]NYE48409.1 cardiolipin synthase [Spinactinospora alkalitolerans]
MKRRAVITTMVKRALLGLFATQIAVIIGLIGIDIWRKRGRPRRGRFPRTEPKAVAVGETTVTIYTYGEDLFADMLAAIRGARHRIVFESFILKGDAVGQEFKRALIEAAERGVEVFVIYDGFANLVVPRSFLRFPPSVHAIRYPAFRPGVLLLNVRKSGRDHRKILAVDGEVGFVGGYNVGSLYATEWRDTHMRLEGPSVWELENAFLDFWNRNRGSHQPEFDDLGAPHWDSSIRAHRNVPEQLIYPIRAMYLEAIDRASEHIYITQAYFIPDREILGSLIAAARRGVDVRILLPETSNHVVADWLSRGFYSALLRGGVKLCLFQDAMMHAKTATIDGHWSTIGTANVDRVSLTGNYEINVEIFDDEVAAHLEEVFANDSGNARLLTEEEWHARPFVAKLSELILAPLRPLL